MLVITIFVFVVLLPSLDVPGLPCFLRVAEESGGGEGGNLRKGGRCCVCAIFMIVHRLRIGEGLARAGWDEHRQVVHCRGNALSIWLLRRW